MEGDQARGTGGVNCDVRSGEIQEIPHARGQHRVGVGRDRGVATDDERIVPCLGSYEDADSSLGDLLRSDGRILKPAPDLLKKQSLARIHRRRLTRRDLEERGIELGQTVESAEPALTVLVPLAIARGRPNQAVSLGKHLPQLLNRAGAGEAASQSNDRGHVLRARSLPGRVY